MKDVGFATDSPEGQATKYNQPDHCHVHVMCAVVDTAARARRLRRFALKTQMNERIGLCPVTSNRVHRRGGSLDDDLLVPRASLQGVWCASDGDTWTIEGDTASVDDGAGGTASLPLDLVFIDGSDQSLLSQTDDSFVTQLAGEEITFTRGSC